MHGRNGRIGINRGYMKTLNELLRGDSETVKANAYGHRLRKRNGDDILLPGHVTDFIEQNAETKTQFDHDNYTKQGWNWVRNTKSKKKYDVYHRVVNKSISRKHDVVDKT